MKRRRNLVVATGSRIQPKFLFGQLTVHTGHDGLRGVRATALLTADVGRSGSWLVSIHFCDSGKLGQFTDSISGSWDFYLPIELLPFVLPILRDDPKRFISYVYTNPSGGGPVVGEIVAPAAQPNSANRAKRQPPSGSPSTRSRRLP